MVPEGEGPSFLESIQMTNDATLKHSLKVAWETRDLAIKLLSQLVEELAVAEARASAAEAALALRTEVSGIGVVNSKDASKVDALVQELDQTKKELELLRRPKKRALVKGQASDVELAEVYNSVEDLGGDGKHLEAIAAVGARVRQEPGLIERLLASKVNFSVVGTYRDSWRVSVNGTENEDVRTADVPPTLAKLGLGK